MMSKAPSSNQPEPGADLTHLLAERYPAVRRQHPGEGRRKWRLRVADEFFVMSHEERGIYALKSPLPVAECEAADFVTDDDPFDDISGEAPGLGILVRTEFSDEDAWQAFYTKLQEAERELASDGEPMATENAPAEDVDAQDDAMDEDEDQGDESEAESCNVLYVINDPAHKDLFTDISNLTALRLLNDVEIRRVPPPPPGTARTKPPNRLVDYDGWQEIYVGKTVWIYDKKSNTDQCTRLVSQKSAMYGTATADSWRARVSHICELQVSLASGALTIGFGGIDRWDYPERVRNLDEAARPVS